MVGCACRCVLLGARMLAVPMPAHAFCCLLAVLVASAPLLVAVTRSCAAGLDRCLLRICVQLGPTSGYINPFMRSWTPWVAVWAWLPMLHLSG